MPTDTEIRANITAALKASDRAVNRRMFSPRQTEPFPEELTDAQLTDMRKALAILNGVNLPEDPDEAEKEAFMAAAGWPAPDGDQ
jgi:hypothetical protein